MTSQLMTKRPVKKQKHDLIAKTTDFNYFSIILLISPSDADG